MRHLVGMLWHRLRLLWLRPPAPDPPPTYFGRLGEMGHPQDRAYADDGEW